MPNIIHMLTRLIDHRKSTNTVTVGGVYWYTVHKVKGLIPLINYLTDRLIISHLSFDIVEKYLSRITCYRDIMTKTKGGIGRHKGRSRSSNKKAISSAKKFSESDH